MRTLVSGSLHTICRELVLSYLSLSVCLAYWGNKSAILHCSQESRCKGILNRCLPVLYSQRPPYMHPSIPFVVNWHKSLAITVIFFYFVRLFPNCSKLSIFKRQLKMLSHKEWQQRITELMTSFFIAGKLSIFPKIQVTKTSHHIILLQHLEDKNVHDRLLRNTKCITGIL